MNTVRPRTLAKGFVFAASAPVVLACIAGTIFVGGHLGAAIFAWLYGVVIALPTASATILVFGVPVYFLYRRLRVVSLPAYVAAGLLASAAIAGIEFWLEYAGGYENANQALLEHATQLVTLISGPVAAAVFWRTARPDIRPAGFPTTASAARRGGRFAKPLLVAAVVVSVAFISYGTFAPPKYPQPLHPLAGETLTFDSTKVTALVTSLKVYAAGHTAHLGYYFIPTHPPEGVRMPPVLVVATLTFPNGIQITVDNPGPKGLQASIYSVTNRSSDEADRIWSDFVVFLRPAVDHANALPNDQLPSLPWRGEGGRLEPKWWDWRFQRE